MYYTPPNKHFKITLKLFHIQSPTESIADKLSLFLILRPTPPGRRLQLQSVAVSLVRDEMWTRTPLPSLFVGRALICGFLSSCWYCSVDVSASCRAVVTGDNLGNVVLLSTSGEEVCIAPCSISSAGMFMAHVLSYSTGMLERGASDLQLRRWVHSLSGWWEVLHFCYSVDIFTLLSVRRNYYLSWATPSLRVLATSQSNYRVTWRCEYPLPTTFTLQKLSALMGVYI